MSRTQSADTRRKALWLLLQQINPKTGLLGYTVPEMAKALNVAQSTVRRHLASVRRKAGTAFFEHVKQGRGRFGRGRRHEYYICSAARNGGFE